MNADTHSESSGARHGDSLPRPRLVVLSTHPIQYHAPLYRCLAQRGAIGLHVIYLSDAGTTAHMDPGFAREVQWDVPLLDGYDYKVLQPGSEITSRGFWAKHDRNLTAALQRACPDWLLVYGYMGRMNWAALHWARQHGVKLAYSSDSNSRRGERLVPVKRVVVGQFFRHVDAFLAPSERNVEYLLKYRADPARIRRMPFAIDVARFTPDPKDASPRRYDFLWAGKFIDFKRGQDFLAALDRVARQSDVPVHACMAGDGPHRETLLALAKQLPDSCHVDFPGFVNQGAMPATLRSAHTFVFTSERDAYGLACTEAAASGLALVVADNNGCVGPTVLAQPGVNALTYKSGDVDALATAMESLLRDAALRQRMQRASLDIAKYHDAARAAKIIEQLVTGNP